MLIGFVEEVAFGGLLLRWLAPRGMWRAAAILSSIAFGSAHLFNHVIGVDLGVVLIQVG